MAVTVVRDGPVTTVVLDRPERRGAVDRQHARALADAFRGFETSDASVAVLTGAHGHFCAGADLQAVAAGDGNRVAADGDGPMGPTRMALTKPVIAAIEGHAVAGGLELALWCDLRVVARSAVLGVYCRRWGVPLIDGGTVRLPRIIGLGRALDLILTGRAVAADEALAIGLADRVVDDGTARASAEELAHLLAALPQACLREDRLSVYAALGATVEDGLRTEYAHGLRSLAAGAADGASRFASGAGRHGDAALGGAHRHGDAALGGAHRDGDAAS